MVPTRSGRWEHFVRSAAHAPKSTGPSAVLPGGRSASPRAQHGARRRPEPAAARPSPARDLRLLPGALAAWGAAALAIRLEAQDALLLGGLLALGTLGCAAVVVVRIRKGSPAAQILLIFLGVAAMICLAAAAHLNQRSSAPLSAAISAEAHMTVKLRAVSDPREASTAAPDGTARWLLEAELLEATYNGSRFAASTPVMVLGSAEWSTVAHGDVLRSAGKPLSTEPGARAGALLIATTAPVLTEDQPTAGLLVERLRNRFLTLSSSTSVPDDGLMPGMVIGARSAVEQDLVDTMKATGLTHLTAVSGANCSYVLAFVFLLCRGCRLPRWAAAGAGVAALVGFVLLVRPEPSVLRAAVMGAIGVLAVLTGRGRLSMTLLFLSIAALLAADPWLGVEYAFILSVAATCGLVLAGPLLAARLASVLPVWMAQLVAVPLAAQLFCSPVLALIQPSLPTYSLPANIAASPLVPFITITGMVAVVLVALAPWAAAPFAVAAGWAAVGVAEIARLFASAPLAAIPWPGGWGGAVLTALISGLVLVAVVWGPQLIKGMREALRAPATAPGGPAGRSGALMRTSIWVSVGCVLGAVAVWVWNGAGGREAGDWTVAACDVGQGDGLAVRTGPGSAMVFDAGPDPGPMDACLDRLGVDTVDVLVLTHLHEDHFGGIAGVFEDRTVDRVLYSTAEDSLPGVVTEVTGGAGIEAEAASAGVADTTGNVNWSVLWPAPGPLAGSENNASAVVLVTVAGAGGGPGLTILFTGDLEEDAAARFLAAHPHLAASGVDILKVAHHGARNGGADIIEAVSPELALISAGQENDYGHPHPETLDALQQAGVDVARTDLRGTILLTLRGDDIHIGSSR
ncbi:ComEC/Rec2 family competence protein [Arthrobacter tumbae]|uniref:ComEC/Rec2 family competence protein n=1 Tax=Arthrobacter tumbae TaxID=163874 RepID=UPI00195E47F1|nr:ComEC/Rec2 family competence protein [Arthrobacter tumbae]MBM7783185.1 competence protein ComEC [Arthrobacter tumbae]